VAKIKKKEEGGRMKDEGRRQKAEGRRQKAEGFSALISKKLVSNLPQSNFFINLNSLLIA
jgi:hypothetical protein